MCIVSAQSISAGRVLFVPRRREGKPESTHRKSLRRREDRFLRCARRGIEYDDTPRSRASRKFRASGALLAKKAIIMMFFRFIFAWVLMTWARCRGYETLTSAPAQYQRFQHCAPCQFFADGMCLKCGCLIQAKIMLTMEKCPIKSWQRLWVRRVTVRK